MSLESTNISERQLEWIEQYFFLKYDEAYRKHTVEDYPNGDEVRAYKEAMETVTTLRNEMFDGKEEKLENTVDLVESALLETSPESTIDKEDI